jgi:hypothetical protein
MSLEHSPARGRAVRAGMAAYTIDEFCTAHRISRGMLYKLWRKGLGPRFMNVGIKRIITNEGAADWRSESERRASEGEAE